MRAPQRASRARRKLAVSSEVKHIPEQHQLTVGHSPTFPSKLCGTTVPQPQVQRILCRYASGASVRQIARIEKRDRATVSKIVKSEDMTRYVASMRERFFALADDAIISVQKALQAGDAELGYRLLKDVGIVPSKQEITIENAEPMNDQDARVRQVMIKMASCAIERNRVYGTPLPSVDRAEQETKDRLLQEKHEKQ
jgi:hypothetical protein